MIRPAANGLFKPNKKEFDQSAFSGRLTIAQRFIAGKVMAFAIKSVKRTTGNKLPCGPAIQPSATRTASSLRPHPSSKLLGYCHPYAMRTQRELLDNWQRAVAQEPLQPIAPLE